MSEYSYPTDEELDAIRTFEGEPRAWFDLIKVLWWAADWGWHEEPDIETPTQTTFHISTGGWSGNEEIIGAMQKNAMLWIMTWVSTRRGGHYEFQLRSRHNIASSIWWQSAP